MTTVVRIKRHLDSETLYLPEIKELIGEDVEIVISKAEEFEAVDDPEYRGLRGSVLRYDDPFGPAADEWEALE